MEYIHAALLLHKLGKQIDKPGMRKVIEAAGMQVDEAKVKALLASLKGVDIDKAIAESAIMPAPAAPAAKAEEKKEEKHEAAAEGLSALFG